MWVGREPQAIVAGFVDVLVKSLYLDFAFVRLCDPESGAASEATLGAAWTGFPGWLRSRLAAGRLSHREIVSDLGDGGEPNGGILIPIGVDAEGGMVAAASRRTGFPDEIDQLLLSVAANQAATAFRSASLAHELRRSRDELETKVAERTADLQRAYRALQEREAKIRRLVDANIIGVVISDLPGGIVEANDAFLGMVGFSRDDLEAGRVRWTELTPAEWQAVSQQAWAQIRASGSCDVFEKEYLRKDGSRVPVLVAGVALDDTRTQAVSFVLDLTERKRAENERERMRRLEADLAHIDRVSTMGELTASLAHELNQPIAAAITNAKTCLRWLTRDEPDLDEAREAALRIVDDGTRAGEIINRIRSFYKKAPPRREPVDVNEIAGEMFALLRHEADRHAVVLRAGLTPDLPRVTADRVQLQQVFMNLMLNGIEAMHEAPGELVITSQRGQDGHVLISISDTGVGLPGEQADQVFSPFFTTKPEGTGMGLAISRSIIESHGGRLWATSNPGRGATFYFTLPGTALTQRP